MIKKKQEIFYPQMRNGYMVFAKFFRPSRTKGVSIVKSTEIAIAAIRRLSKANMASLKKEATTQKLSKKSSKKSPKYRALSLGLQAIGYTKYYYPIGRLSDFKVSVQYPENAKYFVKTYDIETRTANPTTGKMYLVNFYDKDKNYLDGVNNVLFPKLKKEERDDAHEGTTN